MPATILVCDDDSAIRTVLNHNPLLHKARVVGDYYLNGTTKHLEEGKVF